MCLVFVGIDSKVIALDPSDLSEGAIKWTWTAPEGVGDTAILYDADDTVVRLLYVCVNGFCYILDENGKLLHRNPLEELGVGPAHMLLVKTPENSLNSTRTLYVSFNGHIVALDVQLRPKPGIPTWTAPQGMTGPVVLELLKDFEGKGRMIVASVQGYTFGLDFDLNLLWQNPLSGVSAGPVHLASNCAQLAPTG